MTEREHIRRAEKLIQRFDRMRIVGARGEWSGNARQGFMFNPQRGGGSAAGVGPIPPPSATGACCLNGGCSVTTQAACENSGGTYQGDGTTCLDVDCGQLTSGACCVGSVCSIETPDGCSGLGGTYQGDNSTCDPNPCPAPTGACCIGEVCSIETQLDCENAGGIYQGDDTVCDPNPCTVTGACCKLDPPTRPDCTIETEFNCNAGGGTYQGNGTVCLADGCCLVLVGPCSYDLWSLSSESCCNFVGGTFISGHGGLCGDYLGACCFFDGVFWECSQKTEVECNCLSGTFYGVGSGSCPSCP